MRKILLLFMLLGLVGLMYGCELETTTFSVKDISDIHNKKEVKKSLRKLKSTIREILMKIYDLNITVGE